MPNPTEPVDEFEELRSLLLGGEREQLRSLRQDLEDKERHARGKCGSPLNRRSCCGALRIGSGFPKA